MKKLKLSPRAKKIILVLTLLLAGFEGAYVVAANAFLSSHRLQEIVNSRPEKLLFDYKKAWTLVPGLVSLEGVVVEGHDGELLWHIEIPKVRVLFSLLSLPSRTLRTYSVRAQGGIFRIKKGTQLPPEDPKPEADLTASEIRAKEDRGPFHLSFGGLSLQNFSEITVMDYSYRGPASIGGSFKLWPGRSLIVSDADVRFLGGQVFLGERTLSSSLEGSVNAEAPEWLPREQKPSALIDTVDAEIKLKGQLEDADFLNHYVEGIPWLKILGVTGNFSIDATIKDGAFANPSEAQILAKKMGAGIGGYQAQGVGKAEWKLDAAGENPLMRMRLNLRDYVGVDTSKKLTVAKGENLRISADSYDLKLTKMFSDISDLSAAIVLDKVELTDLRFVNAFIPMSQHFEVLEGTATLEAKLNVSTRRATEPGFCKLETFGTKMRFRKTELAGDFAVTALVEDATEGTDSFKVSGSRFAATNVTVVNKDKKKPEKAAAPWAGELSLVDAWIESKKSDVFRGTADLRLDDARPILSVLSNTSRIARIVTRFADMKNLKGKSDFRIGKDLVEFTGMELHSSDVDLQANFSFAEKTSKSLALLHYGIFEAALQTNGEKSESKLIKARKWYEQRLPWKP
ncbi:MAG: hypothetical protein ABIR96_09855 [Bdellovibrionota bacterium]